MNVLNFTVHEVRQDSPLCYVVSYAAEVTLIDVVGTIDIELVSTVHDNYSDSAIKQAIVDIRAGFHEALDPLGKGAIVRLSRLWLHDVDYISRKQQEFSRIYLSRAIYEMLGE